MTFPNRSSSFHYTSFQHSDFISKIFRAFFKEEPQIFSWPKLYIFFSQFELLKFISLPIIPKPKDSPIEFQTLQTCDIFRITTCSYKELSFLFSFTCFNWTSSSTKNKVATSLRCFLKVHRKKLVKRNCPLEKNNEERNISN